MEPTNTNPVPPVQPSYSPAPEHHSSIGTVVAVIVILAVIALGALYFWGNRGDKMMTDEEKTAQEIQKIQEQSTSDETSSIEADLNSTEIDNLDAELNAS